MAIIFRKQCERLALAVVMTAFWSVPALAAGSSPATASKPRLPSSTAGMTAAGEASNGLDGRDIFQVLLGEIALKRGESEVAAQAYASAAERTGDEGLFSRAVQVAISAQQYDVALTVSQHWVESNPQSAPARHSLVSVLAGLSKSEEMQPHLIQLLALDEEGRPRNILHLARLYGGTDPELALQSVQTLLAPYMDMPEAHFSVASHARAAGQNALALKEVKEASSLRPGWPVAAYLEAQLQTTADDAIAVWTRFFETTTDFEQAYVQRARLYAAEKRYAEAKADFKSALNLKPDSQDSLYALAVLSLQLNQLPDAQKYFEQLEGRDFGGKNMVEYQLGLLAQDRGDIDEAVRHFSAVSPGDHYVTSRLQLALILSRQGKHDEARQMLAAVTPVTATDRARVAIAQAQLLRESKEFEAAFSVLEKALLSQPDEPDLLYDAAMLAERLKKMDVVDINLAKVIELRPDYPHAYNALGYSWADRNVRLDEARQLIVKALALAPKDPFILDSMGWVMYRLGKPKVALAHLEEAYAQRPDPEIAAHLGEVLWALERRAEARKLWSEALKKSPDNEALIAVIEKFKP